MQQELVLPRNLLYGSRLNRMLFKNRNQDTLKLFCSNSGSTAWIA